MKRTRLKDVTEFQKPGYWLAVVVKRQKLKLVSVAKDPKTALNQAKKLGFTDASLMMSARHYGAWTMSVKIRYDI